MSLLHAKTKTDDSWTKQTLEWIQSGRKRPKAESIHPMGEFMRN